jgi:hypothetical protein
VRRGEQGEAVVIDLARALGETDLVESIDGQISRLARLIAGETFRQAWANYRQRSASWRGSDPGLGLLDPLLRIITEAGPVAVYNVNENFFPLAVWLKEPMRRAIGDVNRRAERFMQAQENLEQRMELTTEVRRGDFARRLAGPSGAYMTDAIVQASGVEALREALRAGPQAFFQAYDRATQVDKNLEPLSRAIRDRLRRD